MAKPATATAPSRTYRIAREGRLEQYRVESTTDGRSWMTGLAGLTLKQAQNQLQQLKIHGCKVREAIA